MILKKIDRFQLKCEFIIINLQFSIKNILWITEGYLSRSIDHLSEVELAEG